MRILPKEQQKNLKHYHESTKQEIQPKHIVAFREIVSDIFGGFEMTDSQIIDFIHRSLDCHVRSMKK